MVIQEAKCPKCGKPLNISPLSGYVYYCNDCVDFYAEIEAHYDSPEDRDKAIEQLWDAITDEPFDPETEMFDSFIYSCPSRYQQDVWSWFDDRHSKGVAYLLYGGEK